MTALAEFSIRVAGMLHDPQGLIYDPPSLESALRIALEEYSLARRAPYTIQGLDGATETSVPGMDEVVVALGAAGHAAAGRSLQRAESFNLNQQVPAELHSWSQNALQCFKELLELIRLADFHNQGMPPWAEQGWALDAWEESS